MKLTGVVCPMVTPLDSEQRIDEAGTRRLVSRLIAKGVDGLFLLGTMGEFPMLVEAEKERLVEIVADENRGRVKLLVNVSAEGPRKTELFLKKAVEAGADLLVLTPPYYYNTRDPKEIRDYYLYFSANSGRPILIYDAGKYTNNPLPDDLLIELSYQEEIIGFKGMLFNHLPAFRELTGRTDFSLFQGDESSLDLALQLGADGVVPGICSLAIDPCVQLYRRALAGDFQGARAIQRELAEIQKTVYGTGGRHWGNGQKYALSLLGICQEYIATTLLPVSESDRGEIRRLLEKYAID
ncbi:4-hydroxy-tetrahydrodipicolinate synthase [Hydrogenispora ethanolica]|uniref:4-hydroxy-tetrahydrodipicolinate synthase n=1 Tax=Hydrogenispora ethanolica TaxID=1082276 RepID=A0A4R1RZV1_HYDET|nr:dihydrodipicolinate synthase family protein [Hydrogenispora ethanolica]TCL72363.1 4-hydroxy-tetrahydrodipicolinate synthase [Hydrogenispora ethanolica]